MDNIIKKRTIFLKKPTYVKAFASVAGKKEGEGPVGAMFDMQTDDDLFGKKSWEEAESEIQRVALEMAISKGKVTNEDVEYIFAGDLLGQSIASTFGLMEYQIPLFGLYGACSTSAEAITLASLMISGGFADITAAVTSSHFASAEKQFRYPLEYGNQRARSASWTVTGGGAFLLSKEKTNIKISAVTPGKIVDYGIKDSMNMGAAMAPASVRIAPYQRNGDT